MGLLWEGGHAARILETWILHLGQLLSTLLAMIRIRYHILRHLCHKQAMVKRNDRVSAIALKMNHTNWQRGAKVFSH